MILNITQHPATAEQRSAGVADLTGADLSALQDLLTFGELPTEESLSVRAAQVAELVANHGATTAMIGGAPYFMSPLERALLFVGVAPIYAFSVRESVETVRTDGSVAKVAVFRHLGFVPAVAP